jgi:DNA-binding transcriptional LysR family regulator
MDLHHLKIFAAVYHHKSFTKAAEMLSISQPTISEHIKNLEKEVECRLFDRFGRFIKPTPQADVLYPRAVQLVEDVEKLKDEISKTGVQIKGELCIGASTIPGTYLLPGLAMEFRKKNPGVSFEILIEDSAKITDMVLNHELLCGVVGAKMSNEQLLFHPFVEDELILVARPDFYKKKSISFDGLKKFPFIIREQGSGTRKSTEVFLDRQSISLQDMNISAVLGSSSAVKEAVKSGLGASILSSLAVQDELEQGNLRQIKMKGLVMRRRFYLVQHRKRTLPVQYQEFCKVLKNRGQKR